MDPYEQWQFLESLLPLSRKCQIAEWGMMVLNNPMLRGSPKIRCCLPGVYASRKRGAGSFHGKYLQDCVFVIDPQTAEADSVNFDYNEPRQRDTVVYGRIYLIFEIRVRYYEKLRRRHRRSVEQRQTSLRGASPGRDLHPAQAIRSCAGDIHTVGHAAGAF